MFDAYTFLSTTVEGASSTEFVPIPEGEYQACITEVKVKQAKESTIMDVVWLLDDPALEELTGREKNTVRQSVFLDLTNGNLDMGKGQNVALGRLREAIGQNDGPWSPSMLAGSAAMVLVSHRLYNGATYADIKSVIAI